MGEREREREREGEGGSKQYGRHLLLSYKIGSGGQHSLARWASDSEAFSRNATDCSFVVVACQLAACAK